MDGFDALAAAVDRELAGSDARLAATFPGDAAGRQPVHTVYVPADRYHAETVAEWGATALALLDEHAPSAAEVAEIWRLAPDLAVAVHRRVRRKLAAEPVEDVRVDLEDGYGTRADAEEDADAVRSARALATVAAGRGATSAGPGRAGESDAAVRPGAAAGVAAAGARGAAGSAVIAGPGQGAVPGALAGPSPTITGGAPPFCGVRFRSLEAPTRRRGLRTLHLVVDALAAAGGVPEGFVLTLPKVTAVEQVSALAGVLDRLERAHGLAARTLRFEIQVETPQSVLAADGTSPLPRMIAAAAGRCAGLHYGTYDYSGSLGIAAAYQSMEHPAADHAKAVMQVAAAGAGTRLSDGSTNVLPVGDGESVRAAWRLHGRLVRRSLERGFYQGWDLHPGHLPSRYVACFAFYRAGFAQAAARLRAYLGRSASGFLDEPATAVALAGYLLRGLECGALDDAEIVEAVDVDRARLAVLARRVRA